MTNINELLYNTRMQHNLTQEKVAQLSELSITAYARIERGETDPHWSNLREICMVLNINTGSIK